MRRATVRQARPVPATATRTDPQGHGAPSPPGSGNGHAPGTPHGHGHPPGNGSAHARAHGAAGASAAAKLSKADFQSDQETRWCPGCGDYAVLSAVQQFMPELGIPPERIVFITGI